MTSTSPPFSCSTRWVVLGYVAEGDLVKIGLACLPVVLVPRRTALPPFANDLSTNGPVPIGLAKKADSLRPPKSFGKMALANTEMSDRNGAQGWESSKVTVRGPVALSDLMAKSRKCRGPAPSVAARWIENTTSAGVTGLPSENLTPGRRAKVQVFPSGLTVWPSASQGIDCPWGW